MKRLVLAIAGGFLAGFFCYHAIFEARVLAQSSDVPRELVNQKFVLVDESRKAVGGLSFDRSGKPGHQPDRRVGQGPARPDCSRGVRNSTLAHDHPTGIPKS